MSDPTPEWVEPTETFQVVQTRDCVRYTDPDQFEWFWSRINRAFGTDCNVRFDPDGTTIRWFGAYSLPLGSWLVGGQTSLTDAQLRNQQWNMLRPVPDWPEPAGDAGTV